MIDYLDDAEENLHHAALDDMGSVPETMHLSFASTFAGISSATDIRRLADAFERIAAHLTLPQGTESTPGETTGAVTPAPSPAEPSLVAMDRAEAHEALVSAEYDQLWIDYSNLVTANGELRGEVNRWRAADRMFPPDTIEKSEADERLRDVADRLGGGL